MSLRQRFIELQCFHRSLAGLHFASFSGMYAKEPIVL